MIERCVILGRRAAIRYDHGRNAIVVGVLGV